MNQQGTSSYNSKCSLLFRAPRSRIPLVFYDQLGNGQSTHRRDAPKEFWTIELFMDELDNLLKHLRIADNFDLIGHSWGGNTTSALSPSSTPQLTTCTGILGSSYATRTPRPHGLKRLIISNSPCSIPILISEFNKLFEAFPEEFVELVRKHEREGTTKAPEYKSALLEFYRKHLYTVPGPWPELLVSALTAVEEDGTVCRTMYAFFTRVSLYLGGC
jgi:pimeloyl-ACP methyl ester carboxylesterase